MQELNATPLALASFALQQFIIASGYVLIDEQLRTKRAQFVWAAVLTLYATLTFADGLLMRMTSLPLREILPMLLASQNVIEGLREIGLRPIRVAILFVALVLAAMTGGTIRLALERLATAWRFSPRSRARLPRFSIAIVALLIGLFAFEQAMARDQPDYLYRSFRMPEYVQLYTTTAKSVELPVPAPISHEQRSKWLAHIGPAKNPRHVLYVLLESFRADAVNDQVSPTMASLARDGTRYDNALAEATYTPLSWSVLLFDEAAHDNLFGRHPGRDEPLGSWLVAVMRKAGYEPHVYVSTNLTYAKTRDRLLGPEPQQLDFFQAASDEGDNPSDKNMNDRVATDRVVDFIEQHVWDEKPQFMLLQLDSTHYTYPFPDDHALFEPYSETLALPRPIETDRDAQLLQNRYRNAAHYVDSQLRRVIEALKREDLYDDMAIVLTSDHGEGLTQGLQGHAAVFEATRHVPLVLKFPGHAPSRSTQLISHRDILPTLAEYLQIDLPAGSTRGTPASRGPSRAVLTLAPSGRFGQLVSAGHVTDLRLVYEPTTVTVTPASVSDRTDPAWSPLLRDFLQQP